MWPVIAGQLALDYIQKQQEREKMARQEAADIRMRSAQQLGASRAPYDAAKFSAGMQEQQDKDRTELFGRLFGYLSQGG